MPTADAPAPLRADPLPACPLCGRAGDVLHNGLSDRMGSAPGRWRTRRCPDPACGLLWLDPRPHAKDLARAYEGYYTHGPRPAATGARSPARRAVQAAYRLLGVSQERRRVALMGLEDVAPGRVLDVGCGDGHRLAALRGLGWRVEGQEVDPVAAAGARDRHGLVVHEGDLGSLDLEPGVYDAVTMCHVIEHVPDPVGLLLHARRLLSPGGRLVAVTPNGASAGHARFGAHWVHLDPPRHLHVFTPAAFATAAARAGFGQVAVTTTDANVEFAVAASRAIRRRGRFSFAEVAAPGQVPAAVAAQLWAGLQRRPDEGSGEEIVLVARSGDA